MFMEFRQEVFELLKKHVNVRDTDIVEPPEGMGDLGYACFALAKERRVNPAKAAKDLSEVLSEGLTKTNAKLIAEVQALGPYVNFYIDWSAFASACVSAALKDDYGSSPQKTKALVEHTSVNPNASPHVGRARNAILGDSLVRIMRFGGHAVEVHYFVNDVGKQIAVLVHGTRNKDLKKLKFEDLLSAYMEANKEVEGNPEAEKAVFELLNKFEKGDAKTRRVFKTLVAKCIAGQKEVFEKLNISYDHFDYESEYLFNRRTDAVLKDLQKTKRVSQDEEGRTVLDLKDVIASESRVIVLTRSDGTSLYVLRDLAYTIDKVKKSKTNVIVLGEDQKLYHQQLTAALSLLKVDAPKAIHYSFVLLPGGGKMSTRKGDVVLLSDFMNEAKNMALEEVKKRYAELSEKEKQRRAHAIAVAAVRYALVKVSPEKNVVFDLQAAIRFEGDTGPYLQYTYARASSILRKAGKISKTKVNASALEEKQLVKYLSKFPLVVDEASRHCQPHLVAKYVHDLAVAFNNFYEKCPVLTADEKTKASRLALVQATRQTLENGLELLGIDALEEM